MYVFVDGSEDDVDCRVVDIDGSVVDVDGSVVGVDVVNVEVNLMFIFEIVVVWFFEFCLFMVIY